MDKNTFAITPPMGWNSWDVYGASVTEKELLQNAEYMAKYLKKYGWEYVVCDIQWYEPNAVSSNYRKFADLCMDEFGRLLPAPNRFPSAQDGKGFAPIADYIHSLGLKFGIHIMRGIPRQAVSWNVTIKGTNYTAREIAHPNSICAWNTDMYGVDATKPGAQEYYDSLLELYASWGVDFIKVDDICVKYDQSFREDRSVYGADEVELIHHAIRHCKRPIVLSLSPGAAKLDQAAHLSKYANMWRMTNDFWDIWDEIYGMFLRCKDWSPYVKTGTFPDCDMLPLGHLSIRGCEHGLSERQTRLTREEQRTMLSLWCIFRSPLMLGCELTDLDDWTLSLITNSDVLKIHQEGHGAHEAYRVNDTIIWQSQDNEDHIYLGIFHTANFPETVCINLETLGLEGSYQVKELWSGEELGEKSSRICLALGTHDAAILRLKK